MMSKATQEASITPVCNGQEGHSDHHGLSAEGDRQKYEQDDRPRALTPCVAVEMFVIHARIIAALASRHM